MSIWFDVLAAIAFILGGGNLLKVHLRKISDRQEGWAYSGVTVAAFAITLLIGLTKLGVNPNPRFPETSHWTGQYREVGAAFWWIYEFAFVPLTATIFALLAFYVASAAFRAFRARNVEATILLAAAGLVMIGRIPLGETITGGSPFLGEFTEWLMTWPNGAAQRGIMIGAALGAASLSLRVIVGIERSFLGLERNE